MGLIDAIQFVRGAVQSTDGSSPVYGFDEGRVYARGPAVLASYPVAHVLGTFAMAAGEVDVALSRMSDEPTASAGDGTLVLRAGRIRSTIDLLPYDPPNVSVEPDDSWDVVPDGLLAAVAAAMPFVSDSGTWQRSVKIDVGRVLAWAGNATIAVDVPGLAVDGHLALTNDAAEYLVRLPPPQRWYVVPENSITLSWSTGAWVRCQSAALHWPDDLFDRVIRMSFADGDPVAIGDGFREAFADVVALVSRVGEGIVEISAGGMRGKSEHAEHVVDLPTGVVGESSWAIRYLKPVVAVAGRWWPNPAGPSRFEGDRIVGVVLPRRVPGHG